MKRIYHLSTCSTNQKILKQLNLEGFELIDIKEQNIDGKTLDWLKEKVGSYDALFSKRAMKYKSLGLKEKNLKDDELREYMLNEYTFLKLPFIINEDQVFIGNSASTIDQAKIAINN